jgi:Mrp family chromosome partitioning ATPase
MRERFVVLGLARARADWFRTVTQWTSGAMLPADFVRCLSAEEVRARLRSGRAFSALLVDADVPGLDRDLIREATQAGLAVLVVDGRGARAWRDLGAAAVLATAFSRDELLEVLQATAEPVGSATLRAAAAASAAPGPQGPLLAVCGPGGTGASTVAIALAQGLAAGEATLPQRHETAGASLDLAGAAPLAERASVRARPEVLLADLCRTADQAMLHGTGVVVPSIQELVEAHRTAAPSPAEVREQTFSVEQRGYRLLLGLRQSRHWIGLRARALEMTLDALQRTADVVVADTESDVEGEQETGSLDVEERNLLSRATLARADLVLVVGTSSMKGVHSLVRTVGDLLDFGVPAERLLPVVNRGPRGPRARAEVTTAVAGLVADRIGAAAAELPGPIYLPSRAVDEALRDGAPLPTALTRPIARAAVGMLERLDDRAGVAEVAPMPITPGSLGAFTEEEAS